MSGNQDQGQETAAGDLDGLFETASKGGRMDTDPDAPQMIEAQTQRRSDLDSVLPPRNNLSERIKLGEAQEVATKPTGTGMNDVFSSSGRFRDVSGSAGERCDLGGGTMDDVFGGGGSTSGRMRVGRASAGGGLDDLLGGGSSAKRSSKAPAGGTMDDFLSAPKKR